MAIIFSLFLTLFTFLPQVTGERLIEKIYDNLEGTFCFKRLTATAEYGCTSSPSGDVGVIHFISELDDLKWLIENANAGPYVPIIPLKFFNNDTLLNLKYSGKVSGLVIINNSTDINHFSPDRGCPNSNLGLKDNTCSDANPWNTAGNSLMFVNWGFPIFYIKQPEMINKLYSCFASHNSNRNDQLKRPLCSIELTSHMLAAVDTKTCIRRNHLSSDAAVPVTYCDPLGDYNIYQILKPEQLARQDDRSIILVVARQDSMSMFENIVPGALSTVTALVTLLSIGRFIKEMEAENMTTDHNLILLLVNGESFDYIGSSRVVYDISKGLFPSKITPITLKKIKFILELDQLLGNSLFYHQPYNTPSNYSVTLRKYLTRFNIELSPTHRDGLPPGSLQRFLKLDKDIPGLVLSNYNSIYVNNFYHSIFDTADKINYTYLNGSKAGTNSIQNNLNKIAQAVALSLYEILFQKEYSKNLTDRSELVDELLHCYLDTINCQVFINATNNTRQDTNASFPLYVGTDSVNNTITRKTAQTLAWVTGVNLGLNKTLCLNHSEVGKDFKNLFWAADGCYLASVNYHRARSPAFEIDNYNWSSNEYSTWTESRWQENAVRIFVQPTLYHEVFSISLGVFVLILSFVVVYIVDSRSNVLFNVRYEHIDGRYRVDENL